jgi:hypothetical protein
VDLTARDAGEDALRTKLCVATGWNSTLRAWGAAVKLKSGFAYRFFKYRQKGITSAHDFV